MSTVISVLGGVGLFLINGEPFYDEPWYQPPGIVDSDQAVRGKGCVHASDEQIFFLQACNDVDPSRRAAQLFPGAAYTHESDCSAAANCAGLMGERP